jgi:hypothetical protein
MPGAGEEVVRRKLFADKGVLELKNERRSSAQRESEQRTPFEDNLISNTRWGVATHYFINTLINFLIRLPQTA